MGDNEVRRESEVNWASAAARLDAQSPSFVSGKVIEKAKGGAKMIILGVEWTEKTMRTGKRRREGKTRS